MVSTGAVHDLFTYCFLSNISRGPALAPLFLQDSVLVLRSLIPRKFLVNNLWSHTQNAHIFYSVSQIFVPEGLMCRNSRTCRDARFCAHVLLAKVNTWVPEGHHLQTESVSHRFTRFSQTSHGTAQTTTTSTSSIPLRNGLLRREQQTLVELERPYQLTTPLIQLARQKITLQYFFCD